MDLIAIQATLGHAWIATTMQYVHVPGTHIEDSWIAGQQVRCRWPVMRPARRGLSWPRGSAGCVRAVWVWLPGSRPEPLSPFVTVTESGDAGPPVCPPLVPGVLLAWARRGPDGA